MPQSPNEIARELLRLETAALDRWIQGDPDGYLEISASEVTYFDPFIPKRIDGLQELKKYYDGIRGSVSAERYEIIEPRVEASENIAVLSFNFASYGGNDKLPWNCTEVFRRTDSGAWKIIQTHWSITEAGLETK